MQQRIFIARDRLQPNLSGSSRRNSSAMPKDESSSLQELPLQFRRNRLGYICASFSPCFPPEEQPFKYELPRTAAIVRAAMPSFDRHLVYCAMTEKSMIFRVAKRKAARPRLMACIRGDRRVALA